MTRVVMRLSAVLIAFLVAVAGPSLAAFSLGHADELRIAGSVEPTATMAEGPMIGARDASALGGGQLRLGWRPTNSAFGAELLVAGGAVVAAEEHDGDKSLENVLRAAAGVFVERGAALKSSFHLYGGYQRWRYQDQEVLRPGDPGPLLLQALVYHGLAFGAAAHLSIPLTSRWQAGLGVELWYAFSLSEPSGPPGVEGVYGKGETRDVLAVSLPATLTFLF